MEFSTSVYNEFTPVIINQIPIQGYSLSIAELEIGESRYYPFYSLAMVLGYANAGALTSLIDHENKYSFDELYGYYIIQVGDSYYHTPLPFPQFKKYIKSTLPSMKSPYLFTDIEGIAQVLSRNTLTAEPIKRAISDSLGIPSIIKQPSKETQFYTALEALMKSEEGISIERHVYIAGYFADIEILSRDNSIIVEYDENNHAYYDKEKEAMRETALSQLGYTILRIDDSLPPLESAAKIYKQAVELLKSNPITHLG